jgi:hypothetical protein
VVRFAICWRLMPPWECRSISPRLYHRYSLSFQLLVPEGPVSYVVYLI